MPKKVDHDERRQFVTEVAAQLIATGGLDAVRVRDVAAAAGCSPAIVSHYFADKRDLVVQTYRAAAARARARLDAAVAGDPSDVRAVLIALLPLDAASRRDWRVWFAYWGQAVGDPELAAEQRQRVRDAEAVLAGAVAVRRGATRASAADREVASLLLAQVTGLAAHATFDPGRWPAARQRAALDHALAQLL